MTRGADAARFSAAADAYAATMVPALGPVALRVVERAALGPDQHVLDVGTGTGHAAAAARGDGRRVVGVDLADGMLAIARADYPDIRFDRMDMQELDFADGWFDRIIAVHSLLFAEDQVAALREWRRVARPGGRLSLSVPGPHERTSHAIYGEMYDRFGVTPRTAYPTRAELVDWASAAGWQAIETDADPDHAVVLRDEAAFRTWRSIGTRGASTADWPPERHEELTDAMLAVTPREANGGFRIPFGALFLAAAR